MTDLSTTAEELAERVRSAVYGYSRLPVKKHREAALEVLDELVRRAAALEAAEATEAEFRRYYVELLPKLKAAEARAEAAEKELAERNESYNRQGRKYTRASLRAEAAEARLAAAEEALRHVRDILNGRLQYGKPKPCPMYLQRDLPALNAHNREAALQLLDAYFVEVAGESGMRPRTEEEHEHYVRTRAAHRLHRREHR